MPTTYTPGYGGTMTINSVAIPVQNVTVDMSRTEIDVTSTTDMYTLSMAGRVTRKVSCTALVTAAVETLIGNVITNTPGTSVALSWNDGNGATFSLTKVMCVSASKSYDNSGAATVNFQFSESL